jgi:hypothetical protein
MKRLLLLLGAGLLAWTCGGGSQAGNGNPMTPTPNVPTPAPTATALVFSTSPVALEQLRFIIPLGNLNPPGHTIPTDHIYFYFADPAFESPTVRRTDFFAPADGVVTDVIDNGAGADRKVRLQATSSIAYYVDHLIPSVSLARGAQVTAGQRLGTTGGAFGIDLGVVNDAVTLPGLINPSRYGIDTLHADAPLKYFAEPLRSQLYAKVRALAPESGGKIDFDVPGRLSGNWYGQTDQAPLAFAYDTFDPNAVRISMSSGLALAPGVFEIGTGEPQPKDVSVASGPVVYSLMRGSTAFGHMRIEMQADQQTRVEVFTPASASAAAFTAAAKVFVR